MGRRSVADDPTLKAFNGSPSPDGRLVRTTLLIFVVLVAAWWALYRVGLIAPGLFGSVTSSPWPAGAETAKGLLFLLYFSAFIALWRVYFRTVGQGDDPAVIRSLRELLRVSSWGHLLRSEDMPKIGGAASNQGPPVNPVAEKSKSTIATIALLAAAAVVELEQVSGLYSSLSTPNGQGIVLDAPFWQEMVLGLAALSAMAALVCFLVSVDSLDSAINEFGAGSWFLPRHFYMQAIQPKYWGFASLLAGAVFIMCFHSRTLASASVGLILAVGYRHWFPTVQIGRGSLPRMGLARIVRFIVPPFLVEPAYLAGHYVFAGNVQPFSVGFAFSLAPALPFLAALLWALSAPIINVGLSASKTSLEVAMGLLVSLTVGCAGLLLLVYATGHLLPPVNPWLVLSGVLTFPVGTGLYYATGRAFQQRSDLASMFAKVKPLFSLMAAWWLLREPWTGASLTAAVLVVAGLLALIAGQWSGNVPKAVIPLGLGAALAWAAGEYFIAVGGSADYAFGATLIALASGMIFAWIVFGIVLGVRRTWPATSWLSALWPFAAHGVMSFMVAYTCFFYAIIHFGLGWTVIVTACWPGLAILLTWGRARLRGEQAVGITTAIIVACVLLISASVILGVGALR